MLNSTIYTLRGEIRRKLQETDGDSSDALWTNLEINDAINDTIKSMPNEVTYEAIDDTILITANTKRYSLSSIACLKDIERVCVLQSDGDEYEVTGWRMYGGYIIFNYEVGSAGEYLRLYIRKRFNPFPTSVTLSLQLAADGETVTLNTLAVDPYPLASIVRIENEDISYTGRTDTSLTGLSRGQNNTTAAIHNANTYCYLVAGWNTEYDNIVKYGALSKIYENLLSNRVKYQKYTTQIRPQGATLGQIMEAGAMYHTKYLQEIAKHRVFKQPEDMNLY